MKQFVVHATVATRVDGGRDAFDNAHRVGERHEAIPRRDVERVTDGVLHREIRGGTFKPGGDRRGDERMPDVARNQLLELAHERLRQRRRDAETKDFDGDEPIASGIVRAKHGTESTCADLMENPKRPEGLRWEVQD